MKLSRWQLIWGALLLILLPPAPAAGEEPQHLHGGGSTPEATMASVHGTLEIRPTDKAHHQIRVRLTDVSSGDPVREAVVRIDIMQIEHNKGHGGSMGMMGMGHHGHGGSHSEGEIEELINISAFAMKGDEAGLYVSPYRIEKPGHYRLTAIIQMANGQTLSPPVQVSMVYEVPGKPRRWGHVLGYGIVGGIVMIAMMAAIMSN